MLKCSAALHLIKGLIMLKTIKRMVNISFKYLWHTGTCFEIDG